MLKRSIILLIFLAAFIPLKAYTEPLRIWVMTNEPGENPMLSQMEIQVFINNLKDQHNIILENSIQDLFFGSGLDEAKSLGKYILGKNSFLYELKEFQRLNPDFGEISVEFIRWSDALNRILTAKESLSKDKSPDIIQTGSTWIASLAKKEVIENVENYFDESIFFEPSIKSAHPYEKEGLYAVPWFADTRVLYYKKNIFSEESFKTWDAFSQICVDTINNNPSIKGLIGFPLDPGWNLLHNLAFLLWSDGGDITQPPHRVLLDETQSIEAVIKLKNLAKKNCISFDNINQETMEGHFLNGEYGAIFAGSWLIARLPKDWENEIAISLPPQGSVGSFPFVGGSHLAIWHKAKERGNFDKSVALISFLTGNESQRRFSISTGLLPVRKEMIYESADSPYLPVFLKALEIGRSYPPIAEWGTIVENELIKSHIWHIWQEIFQGQPDEIIEGTLKNTAYELRKRLARNYIFPAAGSALALAIILFVYFRRRYSSLKHEYKNINEELQKLNKPYPKKKLHDIEIKWNGCIFVDNNEVRFDNAGQAHRLINYLSRELLSGNDTISCLWGYPLFGWESTKLRSLPNRLFNTAVAKINTSLSSAGTPPLLKSGGRNSWRWKCIWDTDLLLKNSAAAAAIEKINAARQLLLQGNTNEVIVLFNEAVKIDPRSLEAGSFFTSLAPEMQSQLDGFIDELICKLQEESEQLDMGISALENLLSNNGTAKKYEELIAEETLQMKNFRKRLNLYVESFSQKMGKDNKSLFFNEIISQLSSIQSNIFKLKSEGIANKDLWGDLVHSENFIYLTSIPQVQVIINRLCNNHVKEDPRLVQLALAMMLTNHHSLKPFKNISSEGKFFQLFEKELKKHLEDLTDHFSILNN